jgi:beta-lactamase regulating signal transducer with metallopeptidase domain
VPLPHDFEKHVAVLAERLGLRRAARARLRLLASHAAPSPAVFGLWRPTLLLPADLLEGQVCEKDAFQTSVAQKLLSLSGRGGEPDAQLDTILAHELIHIRRGDTTAALLQLLAQLLWWFHPLVW